MAGLVNVLAVDDGTPWACQSDGTGVLDANWSWTNLSSTTPNKFPLVGALLGAVTLGNTYHLLMTDLSGAVFDCYPSSSSWTSQSAGGVVSELVCITTLGSPATILVIGTDGNLWRYVYDDSTVPGSWSIVPVSAPPAGEKALGIPLDELPSPAGVSATVIDTSTNPPQSYNAPFMLGNLGDLLVRLQEN